MIFITYGTQPHDFKFLSEMVNEIDSKHHLVVQIGESKNIITNQKAKVFKYVDNFDQLIDECQILITHGGVGSIMSGLKKNKKVIVIPRLSEYKEHVDNHQIEITNELAKEGYVYYMHRNQNINSVIEEVEQKEFKKYESNTRKFIENFEKILRK